MSVVVVIPVYNRVGIVFSTIESVVGQTRLPDHLVVVDDGSTDGLSEAFDSWEEKRGALGCPITFIQQPNQGVASARNVGMKAFPDADRYAFLDSDDLWPRDFLERCLRSILNSQDIVAATLDREELCGRKKSRIVDMSKLIPDPQLWMFRYGAAILSGTLLKGDAVRELKGFAEEEFLNGGEDAHLLLRLANLGQWIHVPGAPYQYRSDIGYPRLHESVSQSRHRWAFVCDEFYNEMAATDSARDRLFRKVLAKRWREAGDQHRRQGRKSLSAESYKRSNSYSPNIRAYYGSLRL